MNDSRSNINPLGQPGQISPEIRPKQPKASASKAFGQILADQISKTPAKTPAGIGQLPEIEGAFNALNLSGQSQQTLPLSREIETALSLLDRYAAFLGDPAVSLKQSSTLLDQLLGTTRDLTAELDARNHDPLNADTALKDILARIRTLAEVEQIKLNRGDYL